MGMLTAQGKLASHIVIMCGAGRALKISGDHFVNHTTVQSLWLHLKVMKHDTEWKLSFKKTREKQFINSPPPPSFSLEGGTSLLLRATALLLHTQCLLFLGWPPPSSCLFEDMLQQRMQAARAHVSIPCAVGMLLSET